VALVAEHTPHHQVEALLRAGCDDVVALPFTPRDLDLRREVLRRARRRHTELARGRVALRSVALHDGLTGLWSKSAGMGQLYREAARSARRGSPLTVALLDIDFFRRVNNEYGHLCGDEALRAVAERLVGGVRPYDVVSRFGGEEFLVVSPDIAAAEGCRLVERLREAAGEAPVPTSSGPLRVTLSAGLVDIDTLAREYLGRGGPDVLVRAADEALARAKRSGRNHTVSWSPEISRLVRATG
jgi:diguanylate cyclase (GGDEF)-like protein